VFSAGLEPTFLSNPLVRGNEVVVEDAIVLGPEPRDVVRYVRGVDLPAVARLAPLCPDIPLMYEHYVARHGAVLLPDFLGVLSLLVSRGVLRAAAPSATSPR